MKNNSRVAAVAICLVLAIPALAWAHAQLVRSTPSANARLTKPPKEIDLTFSEVVRVPSTFVTLKDSAGHVAPTGKTERDSGGRSVRVAVQSVLRPGRYTVEWKNQALNGHPESGSFFFRVLVTNPVPPPG